MTPVTFDQFKQQKNKNMNIKWHNIIATGLGVAALIFALHHQEDCQVALDSINHTGSANPSDQRLAGFMVLGLIGVVIIAIVKILTHSRPNDRRGRRDEPPED